MMKETKISSQMTVRNQQMKIQMMKKNQLNDSRNKVTDSENECEESTGYPQLSYQVKKVNILKSGVNSRGNLDNKRHSCVFCEKMYPNIARHLSLKHSNEPNVAKILVLRKKSKERRKLWEELVNRGDFAHNYKVLEKGSGLVIPKYRTPGNEQMVKDYIPSQVCRAFYKSKDMWKHQKLHNTKEN